MKIRSLTAAVLAASMALSPLAVAQQNDPQKLVETMDVRVINIDVVVTDKKGNPVTGLTQDDFEIYENNVKKPISNFYEVRGAKVTNAVVDGAPAAPAAPAAEPTRVTDIPESQKRRIIFYIDNLSMAPFNRNRVFKQMKDFVTNIMRPGDEAMVATFNRSMKVRVPFTRDAVQVQQMFDAIAGESALGVSNKSEERQMEDRIRDAQTYDEAIGIARNYASSIEHDLRQSVASINGLMATLAGVEGKKILVLASEGFPMQPGREAFYFIDAVASEKQWSNVTGASMLEGMSFNSSRLIQEVARSANANGITLYAVHAAGLTGGSEMSAENRTATPFTVTQAAISNTQESLQMMAEMTGGVASISTNNFAETFKRIERDLDSYYSLGYRAGTERVDRQRYLTVRTKQKGLQVRNRQTFVEKSTYAEMTDRVIANLLYRTKTNDLGILARVGTPRPSSEGLFVVPIDVQIPIAKLTMLPQGEAGDRVGGFDVYVAVANKLDDMSDVARKSHQVRIPAADYKTIGNKYYTYTLELLMERGLNKISVGVVDTISNEAGFAREQIIAQDLR